MDRLSEVLNGEEFCVTAVRGVTQQEVLDRLGITNREELSEYRIDNGAEHLGMDARAVRLYSPPNSEWFYLIDVNGHEGASHRRPVLRRLSQGTEVISVWSLLSSTTHVTQARGGEIVATCSTWLFEPASGSDPDRLNGALERAGFFREDESEEGFDDARAALEAVEEEFRLRVESSVIEGPLPTVVMPIQLDRTVSSELHARVKMKCP
ncbi:DUF6461 domain-containing protein [Streptomyces sp. NPDC019826]|uniref:DUF6461 domain-containing protein n=1 Tax=unclassified Streptomyces TaxID=2593676 RepID=UPI0029B93162|nr:DUF6461 domain-containing protein [Streptomyces sp. WI03-5b]MDX2623887.1 DUF6461 domain-containing protein [Streptomyces sp. WI03-5b]